MFLVTPRNSRAHVFKEEGGRKYGMYCQRYGALLWQLSKGQRVHSVYTSRKCTVSWCGTINSETLGQTIKFFLWIICDIVVNSVYTFAKCNNFKFIYVVLSIFQNYWYGSFRKACHLHINDGRELVSGILF